MHNNLEIIDGAKIFSFFVSSMPSHLKSSNFHLVVYLSITLTARKSNLPGSVQNTFTFHQQLLSMAPHQRFREERREIQHDLPEERAHGTQGCLQLVRERCLARHSVHYHGCVHCVQTYYGLIVLKYCGIIICV